MKFYSITLLLVFCIYAGSTWNSFRWSETGAPRKNLFQDFDTKNNMWLGYNGNTIISFDGEYFTHHRIDNESIGLDSIVGNYYLENDSIFWLKGLNNEHDQVKFNLNSKEYVSFDDETIGLNYDNIYAPVFSPNNEI